MNKIYSLLSLFLIITSSFGQNKQREIANNLFESYQYVDAIEEYLNLIENNQSNSKDFKHLADSYYNIFNIEEAAKWYSKAIEREEQDAETYYRFSEVLRAQGKYNEANLQMDKFSKLTPNDQRAIAHAKNPNYIPQLANKTKLFNIEEISINSSENSDFGAVLSNDNILYFVSTRKSGKKEDSWTKQPYLDIFKTVRNEDGTFSDPARVNELNTPYHDGPISISADGKTMVFSRDGHSEGDFKKFKNKKIKVAQQGLYEASFLNGKWTNISALSINSKDYTVSHPSLSADGKTLYFASNMPGGKGDTDIWKVSIDGNSYGSPENLGSTVNTPGKEGYPFIVNNILYFASRGKQGLGGFDLFKVNLNTNEEAINLGKGINSKADDFSFSFNSSKNVGYFSSNRSGNDNIYIANPICQFEVIALVKDSKTNNVISGASVSISDNKNNIIDTQLTSIKGGTLFNVSCESTYTLNISKEGYETAIINVSESKGENVSLDVNLDPIINELITETEVKLNNIYFEFNKSNITQQGAFELDKLVEIMKDYPEMNILVRSHTDSKGNSKYNLNLSDKRAQSTVQYIISKGINKERLSAKGLGNTEPKIDCKSNCSDEEHAQNRRSEFLIIKE